MVEITHAGNKKTVNKSVVCQNSDRKVANREMGLPVAGIMEEVEHELLHMNDELSDEVDANIEVEEDADENMEVEEEVDDNMENDLDGITLEIVDGMKEGSRWLIVNDVHICHKQKVFKGHDVWRCEDFRQYRCPFKIVTTREEGEKELRIVRMTKAIAHNCSKDKVKPILHKFKLKLNKRMREEVDLAWRKIWDEERKKLIDGLKKESPLLLNQVLLELKDAKSFRVSAQKARVKGMPKIPKDHDEMDPSKVEVFCDQGIMS